MVFDHGGGGRAKKITCNLLIFLPMHAYKHSHQNCIPCPLLILKPTPWLPTYPTLRYALTQFVSYYILVVVVVALSLLTGPTSVKRASNQISNWQITTSKRASADISATVQNNPSWTPRGQWMIYLRMVHSYIYHMLYSNEKDKAICIDFWKEAYFPSVTSYDL